MPYTAAHKEKTRARIVEAAREVFNRKGFAEASIDEIMTGAGLTRGGFYNHFETKEDLFVETVAAYGKCNPADRWDDVELDFSLSGVAFARQMIDAYLSRAHLADVGGHCPMIALPSDVARASPRVKDAYRGLLEGMVGVFAATAPRGAAARSRDHGLALSALCIGSMVLARTIDDAEFGRQMREAARGLALDLIGSAPDAALKRRTAARGSNGKASKAQAA